MHRTPSTLGQRGRQGMSRGRLPHAYAQRYAARKPARSIAVGPGGAGAVDTGGRSPTVRRASKRKLSTSITARCWSASICASTWPGVTSRRTKTPRCSPRTTFGWESRAPSIPSRSGSRMSGEISKAVLVVGGGISGYHRRAREAADAGFDVVLIEKEVAGGFMAGWETAFRRPALWEPSLKARLRSRGADSRGQCVSHPRIRVFTSTQIVKIAGQPGMFDVTLVTEAGETHRPRRRHRGRHRLEALRRFAPRAPRLRSQSRRHHQRGVRADGRAVHRRPSDGQPVSSVPVHPVRRLARPQSPSVLLVVLLHDDPEANRLPPRAGSGSAGVRDL